MSKNVIMYRENLNRPPTLEDRAKMLGFNGFEAELKKYGWVDEEGRALKNFGVVYSGHNGLKTRNYYIEWKATLRN